MNQTIPMRNTDILSWDIPVEAVNEALRFLIRITRQETVSIHDKQV